MKSSRLPIGRVTEKEINSDLGDYRLSHPNINGLHLSSDWLTNSENQMIYPLDTEMGAMRSNRIIMGMSQCSLCYPPQSDSRNSEGDGCQSGNCSTVAVDKYANAPPPDPEGSANIVIVGTGCLIILICGKAFLEGRRMKDHPRDWQEH